jgi:hypothetical protein
MQLPIELGGRRAGLSNVGIHVEHGRIMLSPG